MFMTPKDPFIRLKGNRATDRCHFTGNLDFRVTVYLVPLNTYLDSYTW